MLDIQTIQGALQQDVTMHGWIFTNFSHRDTLTDSLLSLDTRTISSRRWVYIVPSYGTPKKIVHVIEKDILNTLPGDTLIYTGKAELQEILLTFSNKTLAVLADSNISVISTVDAGFIQTLHSLQINTVSAAPLIQITKGLLTKSGIESHERASSLLYKIVKETWEYISTKYKMEVPLSEKEVLTFILHKFDTYSLTYHHEPIVAFGKNTGNPHYTVPQEGSAIATKGDVIQLDIFAKEALARDEDGNISSATPIYADISWVGVYDTEISAYHANIFATLCKARDIVFSTLEKKAKHGTLLSVTGSELDSSVREILINSGNKDYIMHRTGHGIDTACHGSGVNLDSVEFPDNRTIRNGSCFSVEPGLYFADCGMRTEIDIYIMNDEPFISGKSFKQESSLDIPQNELLYIK